jgi:NADH dehydrogenase
MLRCPVSHFEKAIEGVARALFGPKLKRSREDGSVMNETNGSAEGRTTVVIVGGGFAGLNAAKVLARRGGERVRIVLIDRRNHHLFQPLLYQVATAGLSPADISMPIRRILRQHENVEVRLDEIRQVDLEHKRVVGAQGELGFDYLILACGANHSYFGKPEWEPHAPGLKTIEQATEIRRRILMAFERAELEEDPRRRRELMTFVVVGGGPTGVELAGALGEISRHTLARDFRNIDPSSTRVVLVEAGPKILPAFDPSLSREAARSLESLGVTIWTSSRVTHVHEGGIEVGDEALSAATVIWAAGVEGSALSRSLGTTLDRSGRVVVGPDCSLPGHPEVFVLGDQAAYADGAGGMLPGLAPVAIQQGRAAAENVLRDLDGEPRADFRYRDKGIMATVGRASAVAQRGSLRFAGVWAWFAWGAVHIAYLVGFRNRLLVLIQWLWSYVRFKRGARLITRAGWAQEPRKAGPEPSRGDLHVISGGSMGPAETDRPTASEGGAADPRPRDLGSRVA